MLNGYHQICFLYGMWFLSQRIEISKDPLKDFIKLLYQKVSPEEKCSLPWILSTILVCLAGLRALHLARPELAVSASVGALLVGGNVPPPVRHRGIDTSSWRPADVLEIQPVRLGCAADQPRLSDLPAESRGSRFLERHRAHSLQLLVRFYHG